MIISSDPFSCRHALNLDGTVYHYYSLSAASTSLGVDMHRLPHSMKILCENLLRHHDGHTIVTADIEAVAAWLDKGRSTHEIVFHPARVLMQDFTGVPAVVDLAAMRDALQRLGGHAERINPLTPVDLVIDHSVQVDYYGNRDAFKQNVALEMKRNRERYEFLRWGQKAFSNFRVVPPGTGICHQVNLEYLARVVWSESSAASTNASDQPFRLAYPDTVVGTDSHTTMINGLAVLGWGVGGIEAEAAMLGQPISMVLPEVIGVKLLGQTKEGTTATDIVLTVTEMLRHYGVVGKFVEFFGPGLDFLSLADRATIANMAPEYGATCGFFPIDRETIRYLQLSGRDAHHVALVEHYAKSQGLWRDHATVEPVFTDVITLDLSTIEPSLAGPKRPQDRVALAHVANSFNDALEEWTKTSVAHVPSTMARDHSAHELAHGDVVIAAITSCTNTSNPSVMIAAGLLARRALERGLSVKPWVKTSLAPGSKVVTEYLVRSGLQTSLDALGFNVVGYGCTTCIGNSGPLQPAIAEAIRQNDRVVVAVLSGNRNFEGRVHPLVKANYLASPPLVVAYALAGSMTRDLLTEPMGHDEDGHPVWLKDIWPSQDDIRTHVQKFVTTEMFATRYRDVFHGDDAWQSLPVKDGLTYAWNHESSYIHQPPYFEGMTLDPAPRHPIQDARILAIFGDSITTDHISPAGDIAQHSPAARYLMERHVDPADFNSYGARRGNHEVMVRGTFANIRIKNEMVPGKEGGITRHVLTHEIASIYDVAMDYQRAGLSSVVIAGKEYGTGSSRDWAAKGVKLLGVKAVIAESFERIHRSNLIGMGVLPLVFPAHVTRKTLKLTGDERITIHGIEGTITPKMSMICTIVYADGTSQTCDLICRLDTSDEVDYYIHGGILHRVIRSMICASS